MAVLDPNDRSQWTSRHAAGKRLGVSPPVLKRLVDTGKIRTYAVPGGAVAKLARADVERIREQALSKVTTATGA